MYPDLSYILNDLFGTRPDTAFSVIKTFGLFLALAFLAAAWVLRHELKRKETEGLLRPSSKVITVGGAPRWGKILINSFIGFIIGYKFVYALQHSSAFVEDAASVLLSTEGTSWAGILGALIIGGYQYWMEKRQQLDSPKKKRIHIHPYERVGDITIIAAISGIIGAKLFAIFESAETLQAFLQDPVGQLISGTGLAIYGGLIVAFIVVYYYVKRKGIPPIHAMDAVAPALILAYAVGRIGCQLAGDGDWGIINTAPEPAWWIFPEWLWAYDYPHNVLNQGVLIEGCNWDYCRRLADPVFPTPVYETIMSLIIFIVLWVLRKRIQIAGVIFFIYVFLNGIERLLIEQIRVNDTFYLMGMQVTQAEVIALALILIGAVGIGYLYNRSRNTDNS